MPKTRSLFLLLIIYGVRFYVPKLDEFQKSHCQVQFQDSQISSFNVLLVFNIASQTIDIATESWFVGKDAVKPLDMFVGKSNHHAHINHGE